MMALRVGGAWPAGYRSSMPEPLRDSEDYLNARRSAEEAERPRWEPPTAAQIAHMEQVFFVWLPRLGGKLSWQQDRQRLLGLRALCWPQSDRLDPHVWSWRRLGERFGVHHETIQLRHARAVDLLASLVRPLPDPCAATLRRIWEHQARKAELVKESGRAAEEIRS